jgi:hypothetical protein
MPRRPLFAALAALAALTTPMLQAETADFMVGQADRMGLAMAPQRPAAEIIADCVAARCDRLDLTGASLPDYSVIATMPHVTALMLSYTDFSDLSVIAGMSQLRELHIGQTQVTDLAGLAAFPDLEVLHVQWLAGTTDLSPIGGLTQLRELAIGSGTVDLSLVTTLLDLTNLIVFSMDPLDLSPLAGHPSLAFVDLGEASLSDLSPLNSIPNLAAVTVPDIDKLIAQTDRLSRAGVSVNVAMPMAVC